MTSEELKAAVLKANEDSWHARDLDAVYEIMADEVVFHRPPFPPVSGKEANRAGDEAMLSAFTQTESIVHEILSAGSTVVARWTWSGTHTGRLATLGLPATGKRVQFSGCTIYHFGNDKIVEQWEYSDMLGLLQQLGVIPTPE
ncbi:MAG: ester cyclase [Coriobacteriia bacterium]|nr:ester cyclase [Coriobacteriia bacterium]MBN2822290.1 ester cyclase [Coriobacteriia bacterium]